MTEAYDWNNHFVNDPGFARLNKQNQDKLITSLQQCNSQEEAINIVAKHMDETYTEEEIFKRFLEF